MRRAEKARRIRQVLDRLHPEPPIPLAHESPFQLLVAVVLSAQCTDARVNQVTPALFAAAPDAPAMARLAEKRILGLIRSCGLAPRKARALRGLARQLVGEHAGQVPEDMAALEALPGVGHKTASVVMAQAFGRPAFPVDTHIHRLAGRWGLSRARNVVETERDLKRIFPQRAWSRLHLQMIFFGREHCPARGHDLAACPICSFAASRRRIREEARRLPAGRRVQAAPRYAPAVRQPR